MTKKHYEAIAEIIRHIKTKEVLTDTLQKTYEIDVLSYLQKELAEYFAKDNVKFQKQKFFDACKINRAY